MIMGNCAAAIFQCRDIGVLKTETIPRQTIALNFKFSFGMTSALKRCRWLR